MKRNRLTWMAVCLAIVAGVAACGGASSSATGSASNPLIGSWYGTMLGGAQSTGVLTFVDNSTFFWVEDGNSTADPSGQDGMERGTYTWTANTWTPTVTVDTNGQWGWSDTSGSPVPYTISGNVITFGTGANAIQFAKVVPSSANPLIGSWYGTMLGGAQSTGVLTFVDNSTFFWVEDGNSTADPSGQDGMEYGTYTWTATTWTPTVTVDTNGQWGWSDASGTVVPYSISSNVITFGTGASAVSLARIQ